MKKLEFRTLKENEIECRVGNVAKDNSGFFLLLYKNARVDANILDETVGQYNWCKEYYQVKNTMFCKVGLWCEDRNCFVFKSDAGDDDTQMEQIKAEASDSFKRACFAWGIGRELYYSPKIYIKATDENNKYARYSVKNIEYDKNKRIINLVIINDKTKEVVFLFNGDKKNAKKGENEPLQAIVEPQEQMDEPKGSIETNDLKTIQAYVAVFNNEQSRTNFYAWLDKNFGTMNVEMLTKSQGKQVLQVLSGRNK